MIYSERFKPVKKQVVYLDFRAEVSAFDKVLHFSKGNLDENKELLRQRSHYLKRLFAGEAMRFPGDLDSNVGNMMELNQSLVEKISWILGKDYETILVAEHRLFKIWGTSVYLKMKIDSKYTEANAGSGEIAIVQLVRKVEAAEDYALILLDEPEVSVHPEAQEKLKLYLLDAIKRKKLQVVISSHSPALIKGLPDSALKLFRTNNIGKFYVTEDVDYRQAFFDIEGMVTDKKLLLCEDEAAKILIEKTLKYMEKDQFFEVGYFAGGEKTLVVNYAPTIMLDSNLKEKVFLVLDGDMDTHYEFNEEELTKAQLEDSKYLQECVNRAFKTDIKTFIDSGTKEQQDIQKRDILLEYLRFYKSNTVYLPDDKIPEEIALSSNYANEMYEKIISHYGVIDSSNAKDVIVEISFSEHGDYNHIYDTISKLLYKWTQEESSLRQEFINTLDNIFKQ